ncbi:MAG: Gfo/Idh/MocA family oxidoreductase [Bacteroidetes bacterium]|nr:Gfo/Idh/MocA family oxidoreductase [Bacteroidota bacterium]
MPLNRPLRYGMVGGGPGAFIGEIHRKAIGMDGLAELTAGCFSNVPEESRAQGKNLHLDPARVYASHEEMAAKEAALPKSERIDVVVIVTPNFLHYPMARTFLEAGFHVVCEKPMTTTVEEAEHLCRLVAEHDRVFLLMHNYSGYPLVKQARQMVADGTLGPIRKVVAEYAQGWLATKIEEQGSKQAEWRTDPDRAGVSSAIGDIGTHAEHLARYVTGLEIEELCADLSTFVPGRALEDDANMLVRYKGGARGLLYASQVSAGEENNLRLRVYGTKGALEWAQQEPNTLIFRPLEGPQQIYRAGHDYLHPSASRLERTPAGHPEGFLEAFANLYSNALRTIAAHESGDTPDPADLDFPTVQDGARGVHFIHTAVRSGKDSSWVDAAYTPPA